MRLTVAAAVACLSIVGASHADPVQAAIKKPIQIASQPLSAALQALAKERDFQIVCRADLVANMYSPEITGELTATEALNRLLAGTNLTYRQLDDKTVTIVSRPASAPVTSGLPDQDSTPSTPARDATDAAKGDQKPSFWDRFRLAHADAADDTARASITEPTGSSQAPLKLEEVLVTAQKRQERLIDVPISIVALTSEELRQRRVASMDDLAMVVPGLSINSNGAFSRQTFIRGVGNSFGGSNLIGVYLDEAVATAPISYTQLDLRTYDLERVEVLRGPQGTLYGEGAEGGIIRFITRNPNLSDFSVKADVAALFTEAGAPGQRVEGMVNAPLLQDKLGLRIAGTFDHGGGWIDQPAINKKEFNDQDLKHVRMKGLWQVSPQFAVNAMAVIHRNDAPPNNGEDDNGNYTQAFSQTTTPDIHDDYDLYNLALSYDFSAARLLGTTTYLDSQKMLENYSSPRPSGTGGPTTFVLYPFRDLTGQVFTEEVRLTSVGSSAWQWTVGAFYQDARRREDIPGYYQALPGPPGNPLPAAQFTYLAVTNSKSGSVFGDVSYGVTDRLTLGAGLRYFEDHQESGSSFAVNTPAVLDILEKGTFDALNPRVYARFKLTDQINTYASAAKGFRSGGFTALGRPRYEPESVWTYELGTKMSLAGGRFSSDAAIFYSDYRDYQIVGRMTAPTGASFAVISNAGSARIRGVEWGLAWRPGDRWTFSFNGDYLDTEFIKINIGSSSYVPGDPIDKVPKYQYTLSGQRDFIWSGHNGFVRLDYNEMGRQTYRNRSEGPLYFSESDIINMLNLNLTLQWSDKVSFSVFGQNLLNDRGFTGANVIEQLAARSAPRTYGVGIGVNFD
jgi:iron complex outermembrane recepter protein